ncbi:MAG: Ig domain-containing protein [Bacteroidales bacterium]|nr:Ig domain-containing protein [Bacteroidales bacterium]
MKILYRILILLSFCQILSCTNYIAEDVPNGLSVNPSDTITIESDITVLTVRSGEKWDITALPNWVSISSIDRSKSSSYEWDVLLSGNKNTGYNRSGEMVIQTKSQSMALTLFQYGDKGEYIAMTGIQINKTVLSLTEGEQATIYAIPVPRNASEYSVNWTSSNTSIATVSSSGVVTAKSVGTAIITVKTSDGSFAATCSITVSATEVPVTGVSLDKTTLSMTAGDTQSLTAIVVPSNATDQTVTWSSSNSLIATVSAGGVVTAKAAGSAAITVTTNDGGFTSTCIVNVSASTISVAGVSLNTSSMSMTVGDTQTLTATITPSNATDKSVTWSSSNTSVATVSSCGVVTAKAAGSATITVTTNDGGVTATCKVNVSTSTISVTGVSLNRSSMSMTVGDSQTLTATIAPSNATNKAVTWSSNNSSVATVSSGGVVTAKAAGSATITVTTNDGGFTATCKVNVSTSTISVTGVSLNRSSMSMTVGDSQTLTATIAPSNATNKSVTWSSSDTSVASVSSSGVVTAKAAGSATITVTTNDGGKKATCYVKVSSESYSWTIPEAVDLGLSVKWASFNLGASMPEDYGEFFAWGEISPKTVYDWSTYKWCKGESNTLTKYCGITSYGYNGYTDSKSMLDPEDDAANSILGGNWRMPTYSEWAELLNPENCTWEKATLNGVEGYKITSKKGGYTNNWVFFPFSGYYDLPSHSYYGGGGYVGQGNVGAYWSSNNSVDSKPYNAYCRAFLVNDGLESWSYDRCYGFSIRPVYATPIVSVNSVSLNKSSMSMIVGDTQTLTATIAPSNATDKSVTWSSSNTSIATVSSIGVVTAKAAGAATITVRTNDGGKTAICAVTVNASSGAVTGVSLDQTSMTLISGDTYTLTATIIPSDAINKSVTWSSSNTTVATVSSSGVVKAKATGTATITVTTNNGLKTATCNVTVISASNIAVDMGLSVLWSLCNLGAESPTEQGGLYAWGEIETKTSYSWENYKWAKGSKYTITKYSNDPNYGYMGYTDSYVSLMLEDDAANAAWGSKWRTPSKQEWQELLDRDNCTWTFTYHEPVSGYYSVPGYWVESKITGNRIFIAYKVVGNSPRAYYWTSSLGDNSSYSPLFGFNSDDAFYGYAHFFSADRCEGFPIRPVKDY